MEMGESLSALDSAMVEMIWHTAKSRQAQTKPGLIAGAPCQSTKSAANGSRKVKRPHTAMYSSSSWPRRFITVFRSTWQSAAVSARASHMRASLHREVQGRAEGLLPEDGEVRVAQEVAMTRRRPPVKGGPPCRGSAAW